MGMWRAPGPETAIRDARAWRIAAVSFAAIALAGCFPPIDLTGRACPCDLGWTCDARNLCVRDEGIDLGRPDVGRADTGAVDAGPIDGGDAALDAPQIDAARLDASAPDAGIDAARPDAGTDAGSSSLLCPPGATLCDDFESTVDSRIPPWATSTGLPPRTTTRAHDGVASGLFSCVAPTGSAREHTVDVPGDAAPRDLWLRLWAYVPADAGPVDVGIAAFIGGPPTYPNISLLMNDSGWAFYSTIAGMYRGGSAIVRDRWTCVVFHVAVASAGRVEMLVQGAPPVSLTGDSVFPGGFQGLRAGLTFVPDTQITAFRVHLDDVTFTQDGTALACP